MTKITIIGNPEQKDEEKIKTWLTESLKKLNVSLEEIYLVFLENFEKLEELYQRYIKGTEILSDAEISFRANIYFRQVTTLGYVHDSQRKIGVPPTIVIGKSNEISQDSLLHETAHMLEDKNGWGKQMVEAHSLIIQDYQLKWGNLAHQNERGLLVILLDQIIADYFVNELWCQRGLFNETFRYQQKKINRWIKQSRQKEKFSRIEVFRLIVGAAFWSALPPAYPQRKDEKELEQIFINHVRQMSIESELRQIQVIVSKLKSPPTVANIYKCSKEIIELAQEFLEKQ